MNALRRRNTISIALKELRGHTAGATIYIVAVVFLLLWEFLFFRSAFLVGEASLRGLFGYLPWLFLLLIPALTMGSISQERSEGTLELLLTHPVRDRELLLGKFLAAFTMATTLVLFSVPIAVMFARHGELDWGIFFGQVLAAMCMAGVLIALGIFISSLLSSQMSAMLVTAAASFLLVTAGMDIVTMSLPLSLASLFSQISVSTHYTSMSRGVIDMRDIWYFVSMVALFLGAAYLLLLRRRYGGRKELYRRYQIGVMLFIGIALLTNLVGSRIPGRIDLTSDQRYSLSSATKDVLGNLDDLVNITLYRSSELPAAQQPTLHDVEGMLRDYETYGSGNIVVKTKDTSRKNNADEARSRGVQEMQFNVVGNEEFKVKKGFLGMVISHAGDNEPIPFIQGTDDLEYQLTSIISELTTDKKPKVSFLSGHGERDPGKDFASLQSSLQRQFDVETVKVEKGRIPKDVRNLVVAGPKEQISAVDQEAIKRFLDGGGAAMFLVDQVDVDTQTTSVQPNKSGLGSLLAGYGVTVGTNLVYDLRSNLTATFGTGNGMNISLPYPLWTRSAIGEPHPATRGLKGVVLPWVSSIEVDDAKLREAGLAATTLLETTEFAGQQVDAFNLNPQQSFPQQDLDTRATAVSVGGSSSKGKRSARMLVVGDSDLFTDQFLQQSPENLAFGMQGISWLAQAPSLAAIKVKGLVQRRLEFDDESSTGWIKYTNMVLAAILPALFGAVRLWRRRQLAQQRWSTRRPSSTRKDDRKVAS